MLVLGQIKLIKDFQEWKKMVQENSDKLKEYGMTFIFAGTQANDNTILNTVMHFQSKEHLQKFQSGRRQPLWGGQPYCLAHRELGEHD